MKRIGLFILLVPMLFAIGFVGCKKSGDGVKFNLGTGYFPLQKGSYVTYDVDSILWIDTSGLQIEKTYQLQYVIKDTFTDAGKNLQYVFYSYRKDANTKGAWVPNDVFYVSVSDTGYVETKDELRYIKLLMPIETGTNWDGNRLIPIHDAEFSYFANWTYSYQNIDQAYFNGNLDFPKTLTVTESDQTINDIVSEPDTTASRTFFKEIYADNVGLVYGEYTHWTYDPLIANYRKGYSVIMKATDHN
jgi:hypothetical protein